MKKSVFYSVMNLYGAVHAKEHNGYTDGEYNYYRAGKKLWWCIEPNTGLSIAGGETRDQAQQNAYAKRAKVEAYKSKQGFEVACHIFKMYIRDYESKK